MGISFSRSQLKGWNLSEESLWGGSGHFIPSPVPCCKSSFWVFQSPFPSPSHNSKGRSSKTECSRKKKKKTVQPSSPSPQFIQRMKLSSWKRQVDKSYYHVKQESHSERSEPPPGHQIHISGVVFFTRETEVSHHNRKLRWYFQGKWLYL